MLQNKHIIDILGNNPDKKLIVIGGMHGNEINGVEAIYNILPELKSVFNPESGQIFFLKGNIDALEKGERFIDADLNRLWLPQYINETQPGFSDINALQSLHNLIENEICKGEYKNCYFLDLHTFSAQSGIFCIPSGNRKSVIFAESFGVPFIEKLSEKLPGTALEYFGKKGMTSVVFEGGTHGSLEATQNLEAALWHSFAFAGMIPDTYKNVEKSRQLLQNISDKFPHHLELIYRHKLEDYHHFNMYKGYYNFKPVDKSEKLAVQNNQEIVSPTKGYMLMPLYQKKGSDGFFIVKEKEPQYK